MTAKLLFRVKVVPKPPVPFTAEEFVKRVQQKLQSELRIALADNRVEVRIISHWLSSPLELLILITTAIDIVGLVDYIEQIVISVISGEPETGSVLITAREPTVSSPDNTTMPQSILKLVVPLGIVIVFAAFIVGWSVERTGNRVNDRMQELSEQLKEARASLERQTIALGAWFGGSDAGRLTDMQKQIDQLSAQLARLTGGVDERTGR